MTATVERYVLALSVVLLSTAVFFVCVGESRLGLCTTVYIVEVLALDQVAVHLSTAVKKRLAVVDRVLVVLFFLIAAVELSRVIMPVL